MPNPVHKELYAVLKPLSEVSTQAYLSNRIQVADLLEWILEQTGIAEVWQTSFSISEEFIRRLYFIQKKKLISRFNLVLDFKATQKTIKLWPFLSQVVSRTFLADNHSKILLVKAESGKCVSVITSQNLTRGNRYESAVIMAEHKGNNQHFVLLHSQVKDLIEYHSVPLHDIYRQRTGGD